MDKKKEELLDGADSEVMEWFYECVDASFGVEMVQDSTQLRLILEDVIERSFQAGFDARQEIETRE